MDTIIIGQGYNLKDNSSVGEELIGLFVGFLHLRVLLHLQVIEELVL